jgi:Bacterial SH3 domain
MVTAFQTCYTILIENEELKTENRKTLMRVFKLLLTLLIVCFTETVLAQADCPSIVNAALSAVDSACSSTGRNQACYGNIHLNATPQDGKTIAFNQSGDIADVADLKTLQLSSMSVTDNSWGVALMRLQANLPDTVPGQNVTVLLFGNVEIDSALEPSVELAMTAQRGVNVRLRPSTQASVLASLKAGQAVVADGRLKDSSWVRIKLDQGAGWVAAGLLSTDGDVNTLDVVEPTSGVFGPMQSFYFKSGVGDRPCAEAPDSGILIQTPKGAGRVTLQINDAEITFGSTVYLQAQPSGSMTVTVVEGLATVTAQGNSYPVPAGSYSTVQLDASGRAQGTPTFPQAYNLKSLQTLPLSPKVFNGVKIAPPLTTLSPPLANTTNTAQNSDLPPSGAWHIAVLTTVSQCSTMPIPPGNEVGTIHQWYTSITFSENRETLTFNDGWEAQNFRLARSSENVYRGVSYDSYSHPLTITITFTSATTVTLSRLFTYSPCEFDLAGSGVFQG